MTMNCLPLLVEEVQAELEQQAAELAVLRRARTVKPHSQLVLTRG